jgi:glycosyltransferase involved in cell wall biosynthesis
VFEKSFHKHKHDWERHYRPKISLLIPFHGRDKHRRRVLRWVVEYWRNALPGCQVIIGRAAGNPFCKTRALNRAARKARGKILVLLDADAYMDAAVVDSCADRILDAQEVGQRLWFVPYRRLYRLTQWATDKVLRSCPKYPYVFPQPPYPADVENECTAKYGHRYGAMIMMFHREALEVLGGFDERFQGWGGEDVALLRSLDTLYAKHKSTPNQILHLFHPRLGHSYRSMKWKGQNWANMNDRLAMRYHRATRLPSMMRVLVEQGHAHRKNQRKLLKRLARLYVRCLDY